MAEPPRSGRSSRPSALVVGAASRDLTGDDPRGWRLGGAVTYGALALGRLGLVVRALIGADAEAADAAELDLLRAAGVEIRVVPLARGPVFVNDERPAGRVQLAVQVADPMPVRALPRGWAGADAVLLAPIAGELGPEWSAAGQARVARRAPAVDGSRPRGMVALGWQGLLRRLERGRPVTRAAPIPHALLAAADLVGVSADDLGSETRPRDLVELIRHGATVVITRGPAGGTALTSRRPARAALHAYRGVPADRVVDPTGAGDVFLATLLAASFAHEALAIGHDWPRRLQFAAAAASLVVEGPGLATVPTLEAVRRRVARATTA